MSASNLVTTVGPFVLEDMEELNGSRSERIVCTEHPEYKPAWTEAVDVDLYWNQRDRNDSADQHLVRDNAIEACFDHLADLHPELDEEYLEPLLDLG